MEKNKKRKRRKDNKPPAQTVETVDEVIRIDYTDNPKDRKRYAYPARQDDAEYLPVFEASVYDDACGDNLCDEFIYRSSPYCTD